MSRTRTLQGFQYFWSKDPYSIFDDPYTARHTYWDAFDWLVEPQVDAFGLQGVFT